MTDSRRTQLRSIMNMAWASRRADASRTFASCLRAAWKFSKKMAKACQKLMKQAKAQGGHLRLSPDLTRSPLRRTLIGHAYAGTKAYQGARTIAAFGQ